MEVKNDYIALIATVSILAFTAFSGNNGEQSLDNINNTDTEANHVTVNESDAHQNEQTQPVSSEVPREPKPAVNPTYKVGSKAIIEANHMEGMKGAVATIVAAYSTNAYAVSFVPTTGGEKVNNHKWVIQEEIKNAGSELLKPGTKVILEANHMKGMKGAEATIDSGEKTTVYMVDYTPTTGGEEVKNHKWLVESELAPLDRNK
ncbi:MAG TPA: YdhK family protein [Pseudogracilibacillus sp.]|nr:YdhK family protein [Pseudogracilibacillus sp.]